MSTIAGVVHVERRENPRFDADLRVVYSVDGNVQDAKSVDISATGMQLETESDLGVGTRIILHFAVAGAPVAQWLEGEVKWSKPSEEMIGLYYSGIEFEGDGIEQLEGLMQAIGNASLPDPHAGIPELSPDELIELGAPAQNPFDPELLQAALESDQQSREEDRERTLELLHRAKELCNAGQLESAARVLHGALSLMPDCADVLEELGRIMYLQGELSQSAILFDKALRARLESR